MRRYGALPRRANGQARRLIGAAQSVHGAPPSCRFRNFIVILAEMLYRFLQLDNFLLKSVHAPIDASIVRLCLGGCTERDADLVAVVPPLFRVKTLPLDGDVQVQELAQNKRLIKLEPRTDVGDIAHNAIDGGAATLEIYEGS